MDVTVVGSGYAAGELLRLLAGHPSLKVRAVAGATSAGRATVEAFPQLAGTDLPEAIIAADVEALAEAGVCLLATPHDASLELVPGLLEQSITVVDLSGAFRLPADRFRAWYGLDHPLGELTPAAYGLPELFRARLPGARLIAAPGCYPTAALLALAPLTRFVDPATVVAVGMSGASGAGRGLRDDLHVSHALGNVAAYGAPNHRHTPEIETHWAAAAGWDAPPRISFTPHLVPMVRGEVVTVTATLLPGTDADAVTDAVATRYAAEPFVTVLAAGRWPASTHTVGGNGAHVGAAVDPRTRRVTVSCALDNLVKGAAGQAIQACNVALGLPEDAGLSPAGVYP